MSGREVFEGNHERMGAHVIENAKSAQPPPARAGPSPVRRAPYARCFGSPLVFPCLSRPWRRTR
eukprot:2313549-Prymnesium_polylepis.1